MLCRYPPSFHAMQVPKLSYYAGTFEAFMLYMYIRSFHTMQVPSKLSCYAGPEAFMLCRYFQSFHAMQVSSKLSCYAGAQALMLCRCPKLSRYAGAPRFHAMQVPQAFMLCRCPKQEAAGTPTFAYWIKTWALTSDTPPCLSFLTCTSMHFACV